jgi:hypothetical protein
MLPSDLDPAALASFSSQHIVCTRGRPHWLGFARGGAQWGLLAVDQRWRGTGRRSGAAGRQAAAAVANSKSRLPVSPSVVVDDGDVLGSIWPKTEGA